MNQKVFSPQGSRLTFQLASPVAAASDRFDSLAKTNFSLGRYSNIHRRVTSLIIMMMIMVMIVIIIVIVIIYNSNSNN